MTTPLLLAFYGDDLTGSTDVMESLALSGVETVLFLDRPTEAQRRRFAGVRALGIAGTSRSETPDWMDRHLAPMFAWLAEQGAEHVHYKVCSTFDSSPAIGNIGRAIELGRAALGGRPVPIADYDLRFCIGDYFRASHPGLPEPPFLDRVTLRFGVADPEGHYHVPLVASPWSYQTYRGS